MDKKTKNNLVHGPKNVSSSSYREEKLSSQVDKKSVQSSAKCLYKKKSSNKSFKFHNVNRQSDSATKIIQKKVMKQNNPSQTLKHTNPSQTIVAKFVDSKKLEALLRENLKANASKECASPSQKAASFNVSKLETVNHESFEKNVKKACKNFSQHLSINHNACKSSDFLPKPKTHIQLLQSKKQLFIQGKKFFEQSGPSNNQEPPNESKPSSLSSVMNNIQSTIVKIDVQKLEQNFSSLSFKDEYDKHKNKLSLLKTEKRWLV
jgi:hypothetical protein